MSPTLWAWPDACAYQAAVARPEASLLDPDLRGLAPETGLVCGRQMATGRPGKFGMVFKLGQDRPLALKVFLRPEPERDLRYKLISQQLQASTRRSLLGLKYTHEGIRIGKRFYPTLQMEWCEAPGLDVYLSQRLREGEIDTKKLCRNWVAAIGELRYAGIAHGDLHHSNVRVGPDGSFRFLDYDGMFVPAMVDHGLGAIEMGRPSYQHPGRRNESFDDSLDNFAALIILLTLAAADRPTWDRFRAVNEDDECLLISEQDLLDPDESDVFTFLRNRNGPVAALADVVVRAVRGDVNAVPTIAQVVQQNRAVAGLLDWSPANRRTVSAIALAMASKGANAGSRAISLPAVSTVKGTRTVKAMRESRAKAVARPAAGQTRNPAAAHIPLDTKATALARLLAAGAPNDAIARELGVSRSTVSSRIRSLKQIAGCTERPTLVTWARLRFPDEPAYALYAPRHAQPAVSEAPMPSILDPAQLTSQLPSSDEQARELYAPGHAQPAVSEAPMPSISNSAESTSTSTPGTVPTVPATPNRTWLQRLRDRWKKL